MKRPFGSSIVITLAVTGMVTGAFGGVADTFSYPDGPLTTGSGGLWQLWDPSSSGDAIVSSGTAVINHTTDVARLFPNELQSVGNTVSYSLDVKISAANTANDYTVFWSPASLPLSTGQDYPNSLGITFDWGTGAPGLSNVGVWPNAGTQSNIGTITPGVFHTISGTMTRLAGSISYTVQIDGGAPFPGTFTESNALGINAFEMYQQAGTTDNNFVVDNLLLTPEPATISLLALVGLAAIRRRPA